MNLFSLNVQLPPLYFAAIGILWLTCLIRLSCIGTDVVLIAGAGAA